MFGDSNDKVHAWVEDRLSAYVDGQLDSTTRAQIETHLRGCAGCRTSLDALRWTMSLVKQAPAPKLRRSFVLPVPVQRAPSFGFVALRFATVAATVLLFALIATDLLMQSSGTSAPAPAALMRAPAQEQAAPTSLAFAPTQAPAPTKAPAATRAPEPTRPAAPAPAALPTSAPKPTSAPAATAAALPTTARAGNAFEGTRAATPAPPASLGNVTETMTPATDATSKVAQPAVAPRDATSPTAAPSPTVVPSPTATLAPTATPLPTRVAIIPPTIAIAPEPISAPRQNLFTPLRVAQFVVLFAAVFLAALTLMLWRRR
ncbi:MAG: zf-HC2 domain-containing protein [Chloroflexi bacterium]|nr:zf-HC2 domain-containing protein [Chloroflexota bacterium]